MYLSSTGISPFEHMPSGIDTMTVYVHQSEFVGVRTVCDRGIHRAVEPDTVELEADLALIAVVGRGMRHPRDSRTYFLSIGPRQGQCKESIDQGSSECNIIIGVKNADFETAIRRSTIYL